MTAQVHPMPSEGRAALPENVEAEQELLGAVLHDNRCFDVVGDFLRPEHFSQEAHGDIFAACIAMIQVGKRADAISLRHHFDGHEGLSNVGGADYLRTLASHAAPPMAAKDYAQAIYDCAVRREAIAAARAFLVDMGNPEAEDTGLECLQAFEGELQRIQAGHQLGSVCTSSEATEEAMSYIEMVAQHQGEVIGVSTGLSDLDRMTSGLFWGQTVILAARPSMGKTALALHIARNVAEKHGAVVVFSLEMSTAALTARLLGEQANVEPYRLGQPSSISEAELGALRKASRDFNALPMFFDDSPNLSVSQMQSRARALKRQHGLKLIVIDHIGYIKPPDAKAHRVQQLGDIAKAVNGMAKQLQCAVLLLCQLNRGVESRDDKRPQLSDLRQSGEIEEDAHSVWFLYRDFYYLKRDEPQRRTGEDEAKFKVRVAEWLEQCERVKNQADLMIAKQRHGAVGNLKVFFNEPMMRFGNLQRQGSFDGSD